MKPVAATIAALLLAAATTGAFAQDNAEAGTGDAANPDVPVLDTGEDVAAEGQAPQQPQSRSYVREKIGDWDIQCLRREEGDDPCQMYQLLKDAEDNSVAEVSLFRVEGGGQVVAGATFVAPLETLLTQKLTIAVDSGSAKRYDFSFCTQAGCYARVGFTAEDLARFRAGNVAKVTIVPALAPEKKVSVDMSLTGFTKSFEQVSAINE